MRNFIYFIIFFTLPLSLYQLTSPMFEKKDKLLKNKPLLVRQKKSYPQKRPISAVLFNNQIMPLGKSKKNSFSPPTKKFLFPKFKANKGFHTYGGVYLSQPKSKSKPKKKKKYKKKVETFQEMRRKTQMKKCQKEIHILETIVTKQNNKKSHSFSVYEFIKRKPLYLSNSSLKNLKCTLLRKEVQRKKRQKKLSKYFKNLSCLKKNPLPYSKNHLDNKYLVVGKDFINFK